MAKEGKGWRRASGVGLAAIAGTAVITACFLLLPGANATTVGFVFLLEVLAAASLFGFPAALLASLAATAQYNYFFLPPLRTFVISDSRNWIALGTFLVTATVASELSTAAKRQARAAERSRGEMARLYELSRAILLAPPEDAGAQLERALVAIFGWEDVFIETPGRHPPAAAAYTQVWPLRVGQRELGTLHLLAAPLSPESAAAVAGLVAIGLERERVLRESARLQGLRASEALKSALLDSITHDIRTPLTSIKAAVTTLLGQERPQTDAGAAHHDLLAVIDEESDYLNLILQNMLDMARIESGDLRPKLHRQALAPIVEEALSHARLPLPRVRLRIADNLPLIAADGFLLSQALGQLLSNAAAYSDAGAPIKISADQGADGVRIEIQDQGPGIARELLPRIFDKFFRDPRARLSRPEGLGMGLAIAQGIIQAHHGTLQADSEPGHGARFWFTLPLEPAATPDSHAHPDR